MDKSIAEQVRDLIRQKPYLEESIVLGVANLSKVTEMLRKEIKGAGFHAVHAALRREAELIIKEKKKTPAATMVNQKLNRNVNFAINKAINKIGTVKTKNIKTNANTTTKLTKNKAISISRLISQFLVKSSQPCLKASCHLLFFITT